MVGNGIEIERKFLISYPDIDMLLEMGSVSHIEQTYLKAEHGVSDRVRKRAFSDRTEYTHTVKTKISAISRTEDERQISPEEYRRLLENRDTSRQPLYKDRYCVEYRGQCFEIDVYPFWNDRAIMELELSHEEQEIDFPPFIRIIKEVTHDKRYTNKSLAMNVTYEAL